MGGARAPSRHPPGYATESSAKESLRSAKNVVFSLFCILVGGPMGRAIAPPAPPSGYATGYSQSGAMFRLVKHSFSNLRSKLLTDDVIKKRL